MSYFLCSNCKEKHYIFGTDGVKNTANSMGLPFLGDVPLHPKIRELSDLGKPITISDPKSDQAQSYFGILSINFTIDNYEIHCQTSSFTIGFNGNSTK
jgi:ATP-binding protein involved in chromosome partitioning